MKSTIQKSILFAGCLFAAMPALADEHAQSTDIINQWYASISPGQNADMMAAKAALLLSDEAMIELKDLDVMQTKAEFLDSLDAWADAIENGSVKHRIDDASATMVSATACYEFSSNAMLNSETFEIADGLIVKSVQTTISEDCSRF